MPVSQEAGQKAANLLFAMEEAIDAALTASAKLQGELPQLRQEANLAVGVVQPTLEKLAEITAGLTAVRGDACEAHTRLSVVQRYAGLSDVAFGPFEPKPEELQRKGALRAA